MNTSVRTILSAVSGLALVAYTAIAVTTAGIASDGAVIGISGLTVWALAQMIVLELTLGSSTSRSSLRTSVQTVRTPAVLAFPRGESVGLHAA